MPNHSKCHSKCWRRRGAQEGSGGGGLRRREPQIHKSQYCFQVVAYFSAEITAEEEEAQATDTCKRGRAELKDGRGTKADISPCLTSSVGAVNPTPSCLFEFSQIARSQGSPPRAPAATPGRPTVAPVSGACPNGYRAPGRPGARQRPERGWCVCVRESQ